jgi:hypothetical protein
MRPPAQVPAGYLRRRPEDTNLYRVLQQHLATFLDRAELARPDTGLPTFVTRELRAFLDCGILANGFARVTCPHCRDDILVAFSCKGRGFCPSCMGRRMADTAAHLVDRVFPPVPVRHWILSLPHPLRRHLAWHPQLASAVLREHIRAIRMTLRRLARARGHRTAHIGAVTAIQRAGSALDLNIHFHSLVLDGVYVPGPRGKPPRFVPLPIETADVERTAHRLARRVESLLIRKGLLGDTDAHDHDETPAAQPLPLSSPVERHRVAGSPRRAPRHRLARPKPHHARVNGLDLHAHTRIPRHHRADLERLCRYLLRPPVSYDRIALRPDGRVELTLPRTWSDGTRALVFEPVAFLTRLAALIPRPRWNTLRYHGVFAPGATWRQAITAQAVPPEGTPRPLLQPSRPGTHRPRRLAWADLLRRTFGLEVLVCATCGTRRSITALIQSPAVARTILTYLGLPSEPPCVARARPPPELELDWDEAA